MTTQDREAFIASLRGWKQTLAQQVADYLEDPHYRGVDFATWDRRECARAVQSPYSQFNPACLCHEDYLIEAFIHMLPTASEEGSQGPR